MNAYQRAHIWAVVYGRNWEDIMYFTDYSNAQSKLLKQSDASHKQSASISFTPFMIEYIEDDNRVLRRSKHIYVVNRRDQCNVFGIGPEDEVLSLLH